MPCGVCSSTGVMIPVAVSQPALEVNPLGGAPLSAGQVLIRGPSNTQCVQPDGSIGVRVTVVAVNRPDTWPRWITRDSAGRPVDTGTIPGGCWQGQVLPTLTTTARRGTPWLWLLVVALLFLATRRKQ
jgi:hypothetical protein